MEIRPTQIQYGTAKRHLSKEGVASLLTGILVVAGMLCVAHFGLPPTASLLSRWLMVGPFYLLAIVGLALCLMAIIKQRKLWWMAIPGLVLNAIPLIVVGVLIYRRYA
ncbi:MAG TPA: hypothetical protein VIM11_27065 [Tepidisphaeraceae bacterium]